MRICLQMIYTDSWLDVAKLVVPNVVNYCRKHGYNWSIQRVPEYNGFLKIENIKKIFDNNEADVVWSLDCDMIITNYTLKVEDLLSNNSSFYISRDFNNINAGSFIFSNSEFSKKFIEYLIASKKYTNCEQKAIISFIDGSPNHRSINILPQNKINSYLYNLYAEIPAQTHEQGNWEEGDFTLHLPGLTLEKRISIINEYKNKIIYE